MSIFNQLGMLPRVVMVPLIVICVLCIIVIIGSILLAVLVELHGRFKVKILNKQIDAYTRMLSERD